MEFGNDLFVYLGYADNVHFFSHVIYNDFYDCSKMSVRIYDTMIYNKMIGKNDNMVIYHINQEEHLCFVVQILHVDFGIIKFNPGDLKFILYKLFSFERNHDTMVISFNGVNYTTFLYDFKSMIPGDNLNMDDVDDYKIVDIITISKAIDYLSL